MKRVLIVEPYFGGSHRNFILGLTKSIEADFTLLTLPARKWKMRMLLSAPWFFRKISDLENKHYDAMLCSTFVDVAVLRALISNVEGWNRSCRVCTYFHENQFVYPDQVTDLTKKQFTTINFTTALASDVIAFNSEYNFSTFIENSSYFVKKATDMNLKDLLPEIQAKSEVIFPGIDFEIFSLKKKINTVPVICWNHRWEHDKNPDEFFQTLFQLKERGCPFNLIVLGQSYANSPTIFAQAKSILQDRILHFGYAASYDEYVYLLQRSDIVVSTAKHEFFGISVAEAIHAGCVPLLPKRLSYPELYPEECLYVDGELYDRLQLLLKSLEKERSSISIDTERFSWKKLEKKYSAWLFGN